MAIKASKIQPKKVEAIGMLKEMISGSNDFIFTEYRGLTVERITALRHQLREKGVRLHVVKKQLCAPGL